jgi:hypothetical protein
MILIATALAIPGFSAAMQRRRAEQSCVVNSEERIFELIEAAIRENRQAMGLSG